MRDRVFTRGQAATQHEGARFFARRTIKVITSAVWLLLVVSGCQSPNMPTTAMMPTPALFWNADVEPLAQEPEDEQNASVQVFYASDHALSGGTGVQRYRKGQRSQVLRVGTATVQLGGDGMSWQRLGELSQMKRRPQRLTKRLTGLEEFGVLGMTLPPPALSAGPEKETDVTHDAGGRFAQSINDRLASSRRKNINIYVHGFNASIDDSLTVIEQLHYYLGMDGVVLGYAWPSQNQLIGAYHADKANARFTVRHFRLLLEFLAT